MELSILLLPQSKLAKYRVFDPGLAMLLHAHCWPLKSCRKPNVVQRLSMVAADGKTHSVADGKIQFAANESVWTYWL